MEKESDNSSSDGETSAEADPFDAAKRRELDHLEERLNLRMQNVEQKQESAHERMIEEMRRENAELKAWISRALLVAVGALAALLAVFQFAIN